MTVMNDLQNTAKSIIYSIDLTMLLIV